MREDRVGSSCWYGPRGSQRLGWLRAWVTDAEKGVLAIIEDGQSHCVRMMPVELICFAPEPLPREQEG